MAVRSTLPWPLRWLLGALVLGFSGALALFLNRAVFWTCCGYAVILIGGIIMVHGKAGWFVVGAGRNGVEFSVSLLLAPDGTLWVLDAGNFRVQAFDREGRFLGGLILPGFGLMLRALEMGTAGLKVPTGEVVDFPTNTSDALMSGGAAVKLAPITELPFETVDTLIFDGLLQLQSHRLAL